MNEVIKKAINIAGSQYKLAVLCGVKQPTVCRWLHGGGLDAKHVLPIVNSTKGKISAQEILLSLEPQSFTDFSELELK